ncbi:MAG: NCS2 family permease, partial [Phycisphaerae bacterium]|nr:NCS2 family permease [Phycisphaerae bacterium]
MLFMESRKIKGALLAGIILSTALAWICGYIEKTAEIISMHTGIRDVAFKIDIWGAMKWSLFGSIFSLAFMDMFDSMGTLVACCHQADMVDEEGQVIGLERLLRIDALATVGGALLGTSTTTAYIESAAGIEQGGRTGITAIVTGLLFLLALFFAPIVTVVPEYATAGALIMVGLFMMREVKRIDFDNIQEGFPAFIIIVMIALSYSISTGLAFGFISYVLIMVVTGRITQVKPAMWVIAVLSILFLTSDYVGVIFGCIKHLLIGG